MNHKPRKQRHPIAYRSLPYSYLVIILVIILKLSILFVSSAAHAGALQDILADYHSSKGSWFAATQGEHTMQFELSDGDLQDIRLPNYVWLTNLTNSLATEDYRICEACLLRKNWRERNYLTANKHRHSIAERVKSLDKYLTLDHWLYLKARAGGFLNQTYHQRGAFAAVLTAVTWLPYTAITELVIEPLLIGPLHVVCPLFQVLYFAAIDKTHSTYTNVLHSFSLNKNNDISLLQRARAVFAYYQQPKKGAGQLQGQAIKEVNPDISDDYGDGLTKTLLRSELADRIVINILQPPPARVVSASGDDLSVVYAQLASNERDKRLRFINLITAVPTILVEMLALDLKNKLAHKDMPEDDYRARIGAIGKIYKGIATTEMYLKKITVVPEMVRDSHDDPVYINVHRLTAISYNALEKLIDALVHLHALDRSYHAAVAEYSEAVDEFAQADLVYNVTAARRE
ncbi:MAG: hypothetical protein OYH77_07785 [Pseudomonadota bacterium]|nr:hypothetical protein [Pseudomonadota bacterium]